MSQPREIAGAACVALSGTSTFENDIYEQSEPGEFGTLRDYSSGVHLFRQGWEPDDIFLIREGAVKLVWTEPCGREAIVGLRWPGWFVGASAVIAARQYPATAITLFRCVLEHIKRARFLELLESSDTFSRHIHQIHCLQLCEQTRGLGEMACSSSRSRLENLLQRMMLLAGKASKSKGARLELPVKRRELAEIIAVTPEHLSRLLRKLSEEGLIQMRDQWIVVEDIERLGQAR